MERVSPSHSPLMALLVLLGVAGSLLGLESTHPGFSVWMFAAAAAALVGRLWFLARRQSNDASTVIDFERLRETDVSRHRGWVKRHLRGHDDVVDEVAVALSRGFALAGPGRTLGAFLLAGPTGTGKSFLGQLLGRALFPESEPVVLGMNQFKRPEDVSTLLGPPPGAAGGRGALTGPVLENPYRVIVLDELDKCHPDVRDCLYDVLDSGRCVERSSGRSVFFNACVFIATCNAGVEGLRRLKESRLERSARGARARDAIAEEAGFSKAFLARFDDVLLMDELPPTRVAEVALMRLASHWQRHGIELTWVSPELLLAAVRRNEEFREYGVRQLHRLIQHLTDHSIQEAVRTGARRVRLGVDGDLGRLLVEVLP